MKIDFSQITAASGHLTSEHLTDDEYAAMEAELAQIEREMTALWGEGKGPCDECGAVYHYAAGQCPACHAPVPK